MIPHRQFPGQNPGQIPHQNQVKNQDAMDKNQMLLNQRQHQLQNQFQNHAANPAPITINNQAQHPNQNIRQPQIIQNNRRQLPPPLMGPPQSSRNFQSQSYDENYSIDGAPHASRARLDTDLHENRRVLISTTNQIHAGSYYDTGDNYILPDDNQVPLAQRFPNEPIYDGTDWISIVYNESKYESSDVKSQDFLRHHGYPQINDSPQSNTPPNTTKPGSFQNTLNNESARSSLSNQSNPSSESPNPNEFTQDNFNQDPNRDSNQESNQDSSAQDSSAQENQNHSFDEANKIYVTLEEFKADIKSPRVSITNDCETVRNRVDENPDLKVNNSVFLLGQVHNISRPKWVTGCRRFIGKGVSFELLDFTPGTIQKKYNTRLICDLPCQFSSVYYEIYIPNLENPLNRSLSQSSSLMNGVNSAIGSEISHVNGLVYSNYSHQIQNSQNLPDNQPYLSPLPPNLPSSNPTIPPISNTPTSPASPQSTIFQLKTGQSAEVHDFEKFTKLTDLKIKDFTETQIKRITDFFDPTIRTDLCDSTHFSTRVFMDNFDENLELLLSEKSLQMRQYCSIRLSFIKKFGEKSKYPHINLVPCWIDVTLEIPKRYLRAKVEECKEELLEVFERERCRYADANIPVCGRDIQGGIQADIQANIQYN